MSLASQITVKIEGLDDVKNTMDNFIKEINKLHNIMNSNEDKWNQTFGIHASLPEKDVWVLIKTTNNSKPWFNIRECGVPKIAKLTTHGWITVETNQALNDSEIVLYWRPIPGYNSVTVYNDECEERRIHYYD